MPLNDFVDALQRTNEIKLTVIGRRSRRPISFAVWFALEGNTIYLLPVNGSDAQWYKNLLKNPAIELRAGRRRVKARAKPITDRRRVRKVVTMLGKSYGAGDVKRYYRKFDVAVEVPLSRARAIATRRRPAASEA